jgi:hypothetical protein
VGVNIKFKIPFIRRNEGEMQDPLINQIRKKQEEILKYEETNSECDDTQGNLVPILMSDYFKSFK